MSVMIEITDTTVENRSGTSKNTGKPYSMNEQVAWMHKPGQQYPERIKITLEQNQMPYQPGNYNLAPASYRVDRFGGIEVRPILISRPAEQHDHNQAHAGITPIPASISSGKK